MYVGLGSVFISPSIYRYGKSSRQSANYYQLAVYFLFMSMVCLFVTI